MSSISRRRTLILCSKQACAQSRCNTVETTLTFFPSRAESLHALGYFVPHHPIDPAHSIATPTIPTAATTIPVRPPVCIGAAAAVEPVVEAVDAPEAADTVREEEPDEEPEDAVEAPEDFGAVVMVVSPDALPDTVAEVVSVSTVPAAVLEGVGKSVGDTVVDPVASVTVTPGIIALPTMAVTAETSAAAMLVKRPTY